MRAKAMRNLWKNNRKAGKKNGNTYIFRYYYLFFKIATGVSADRVRALLSSSLWYLGAFPFDIDDSNTIEIRIFYIILNKLKNLMYKSIFYIINPVKDV